MRGRVRVRVRVRVRGRVRLRLRARVRARVRCECVCGCTCVCACLDKAWLRCPASDYENLSSDGGVADPACTDYTCLPGRMSWPSIQYSWGVPCLDAPDGPANPWCPPCCLTAPHGLIPWRALPVVCPPREARTLGLSSLLCSCSANTPRTARIFVWPQGEVSF